MDTGALGQSAVRSSSLSAGNLISPWTGPAIAIVNGESYIPSGEVDLTVTYGHKSVRLHSVAVVPSLPCSFVLGLDWINKCKPIFEYVNDFLTVNPPSPAPPIAVGSGQKLTARLAEDTIIGPEQTRFVLLTVGRPLTTVAQVLPSSLSSDSTDWVSPAALVRMQNGTLLTSVTNVSSTPLILSKAQKFGHALVDLDLDWTVAEFVDPSPPSTTDPCAPNSLDAAISEFEFDQSLSGEQRSALESILLRHARCLPTQQQQMPHCSLAEHTVDTGNTPPVHVHPRRVSATEAQVIRAEVEAMLDSDVIESSSSPWSSPVVLVRKKDGSVRFCVDYRKLNSVTTKDVYPLPRIDDVLDQLSGATFFTSLDLYRGYWQLPVAAQDREKTAFVTRDGLFQFKRMPFGLCNAPASFQRLMDRVLGRLKWQYCLVYLDDVLVYSRTFDDHLVRLEAVLSAIANAGLTLNPKKCRICRREALYLGHRVTESGISPDPQKIEAVRSYPRPRSAKEVRQFLGLASYYRRFVKNFARVAAPLTALLKKDAGWIWGDEENSAFQALIEFLTPSLPQCLKSAPVLSHFDENAQVLLRTDASLLGRGAVLSQLKDGREHVVSYLSRTLLDNEKRWHSNELECAAVVWATKKLRPYLYGRQFTIETDNSAVVWLFKKQNPEGKFAR